MTVAVVSFSDLGRDPRVDRQIRALAGEHRVVAVGFGPPNADGVEFHPVRPTRRSAGGALLGRLRLLAGRYEAYYWALDHVREARSLLDGIRPDVIVANELDALPVSLAVAGAPPVLFDAHEFTPRQHDDRLGFRVFQGRYRRHQTVRYMPRAAATTTISAGIASAYGELTGVVPDVIVNAPPYRELAPTPAAPGGVVRLVHHGVASRARGLEGMIEAVRLAGPGFSLDFFLVPDRGGYLEALRRRAEGLGSVRFREPVPMNDLPEVLNAYDVGLYILEPRSFNALHALPNKLFEFVQARLAVAVGPSPEMARVVRAHDLGRVAADFTPAAMAEVLGGLTPDAIAHHKRAAHAAARELSADRGERRIRELVRNLAP